MSRNSVQDLLAQLQKQAGDVSSVNPPTAHETGGAPEDLTTFTTGERFSENTQDDKDRPTATAEDNPVTADTPNENPTVPVTTAPTGEDPEHEKGVADRPKDPNATSHPANGSVGEKYSSVDQMLAKAASTLEQAVQASTRRLIELNKAASGQVGSASAQAGTQQTQPEKQAGADPFTGQGDEQEKIAEYANAVLAETQSAELANFYASQTPDQIAAMHKIAQEQLYEARFYGHKMAELLADQCDQIKQAQAQEGQKSRLANSFFNQLKKAMEEEESEESSDDAEESSSEGGEGGGGGEAVPAAGGGDAVSPEEMMAADPAMMAGQGGGAPMDPAMMGGDPAAMGGGEDMGMGGMPPEIMAMLEEIAASEGMSVEDLIAALAAKTASVAVQPKQTKKASVNKTSEQFKNLERLCKEAIADLLTRGSR